MGSSLVVDNHNRGPDLKIVFIHRLVDIVVYMEDLDLSVF